MSIIDDFSAIGSNLAQIEKKIPAKSDDKSHGQQVAASISASWVHTPAVDQTDAPIVYPMFGLSGPFEDTAPSEYCAPADDCA